MGRWLANLCVLTLAVGCSGQSNPFMRTTVPPPATGAGAPSDPYYNNSGGAQPPSVVVPQTTPMPGPTSTVPAVPPPGTRYSAPGGYNFPQGSVIHRKAVDPAPNDYRAGASAIARAARPRNLLTQPPSETAVAGAREPSQEPSESESKFTSGSTETGIVVTGYSAEETPVERAIPVTSTRMPTVKPIEPAVRNAEPQTPVATLAIESRSDNATDLGSASVRIVTPEPTETASNVEPADTSMSATSTVMPFKTTAATLTVAPSTTAATATLAMNAGPKASSSAANPRRFYFDRKSRPDAQPAAYAAGGNEKVVFAGGASVTGLGSGPEGAPAYSHHNGYTWLRGKLEYSTAGRRWKLRYIPIDGQTDQFGGSVVLPNSPQLEQFHAGDMVTLEGTVGNSPAEHGSFSPLYELRAIKPQR